MEELIKLIGYEFTVKKISRTLCDVAGRLRPGVVGAMHITCADESEHECVQAFEKGFVEHHLPELKFAHRSAFRISNLGGRYDWGAIGIVEKHFVLPVERKGFKLIVVKVNSHVGVISEKDEEYYGFYRRYGSNSSCCGALYALMAGEQGPYIDELRDLFRSGGKERLRMLMNVGEVEPKHRGLYAAVVSAGLQARQVMADIRNHPPHDPVLYLILPCVTLNRLEIDTEILCGVHTADYRSGEPREEYTGRGDDPSAYSLSIVNRRIYIGNE